LLLLPDLSEYQYNASMAGIKKANGGAAIIRACYGADHPDGSFAWFRECAAAAGYSFLGLYCYLRADQDVVAQVAAFRTAVGKLAHCEIPILDLEEGAGDQSSRALAWLQFTDDAYGLSSLPLDRRSWLYSNEDYALESGLASIFASARRTWVAAYGPAEPELGHTLWQCTNGTVGPYITEWPGAGACDTNVYHGTLAELAATLPSALHVAAPF